MNMLRTILSIAVLCTGHAWAQSPPPIQIPSAPQSSGSSQADGQWRGLAGASLSSTSGNSSSNNLLLNIDMARKTEMDKISAGAMANYGSSKVNGVKTTTAERWALNGQYDYNLTSQLFAFGKLGFDADKVINNSTPHAGHRLGLQSH